MEHTAQMVLTVNPLMSLLLPTGTKELSRNGLLHSLVQQVATELTESPHTSLLAKMALAVHGMV